MAFSFVPRKRTRAIRQSETASRDAGVGDLSREEQQARFSVTFALTAVVTLDGASTELVETLDPGFPSSACSNPSVDLERDT